MVDRHELAAFLRTRRQRLTPLDVALPATRRRRTPGLRREEVAALAGISADYYARLEQARGPDPSTGVLSALCNALCLTDDEADHLFHLAGHPAPLRATASRDVRPGVLHLLERLGDSAAMVVADTGDVLAWTPLAAAIFGDASVRPAEERNIYLRFFRAVEQGTARLPAEDVEIAARAHVADLRATTARRPGDAALRALVEELRTTSPLFARLWETRDVAVRRVDRKRIVHPVVGVLELDCEVLLTPEQNQRLVLHTAPPGSPTAERLRRLLDLASSAGSADDAIAAHTRVPAMAGDRA